MLILWKMKFNSIKFNKMLSNLSHAFIYCIFRLFCFFLFVNRKQYTRITCVCWDQLFHVSPFWQSADETGSCHVLICDSSVRHLTRLTIVEIVIVVVDVVAWNFAQPAQSQYFGEHDNTSCYVQLATYWTFDIFVFEFDVK